MTDEKRLQEIKDYLRVDYTDDDELISGMIIQSQSYIDLMVGEDYKQNDKCLSLAEMLQRKIIEDLYNNRGSTIPVYVKRDMVMASILDVLSLYEPEV